MKYARAGSVTNGDSKKFYRLYKRWDCMMHRCYNPNHQNFKYYGGIGVTVCDRWFDFSNFIYDVQHLPGYNKFMSNNSGYHLDKDFIQHFVPHSMRVYSPDTCIWMDMKDNIKLSYKLDILYSAGCRIRPLINGNYSADIVINSVLSQYGVYETISDIFDNFLYLSVNSKTKNNIQELSCYNDRKEMCYNVTGCIDMCKII